jgi:hypothetical protein
MKGSAMGIMRIYWESGGTYTSLFLKSGQQHAAHDTPWTLHDTGTTLHNKDGETGNIVIIGQKLSNATSNNFRTDAAFCEFSITTQSGTVTLNNFGTDWKTASTNSTTLADAQAKSTTVYPTTNTNVWQTQTENTGSSGTGPDQHHDDTDTSEYIYFEGTDIGASYMATLRTASTITL